ncbi:unnamed protein product [Schistosoma rodhaini]|uniref:IC97/Casc1 N-terminal domain-containing protein n=1 Tax=Schistosoma rodhaini TaxID=6188 RepID=A0AA85FMF8_9TREM|nr:unnamed protein product [Schistosoma rodhaini]
MASRPAKKNRDSSKKLNNVDETKLRELEEEKERLREEKELELRKALQEKEDLKIRIEELKETRTLINEQNKRLQQLELQCRNQYTWKRYFQCDDLPNPTLENEINTYISLWNSNEQRLSIEDVMDDCVNSFKIIDELNLLISQLMDTDEDHKILSKYNQMKHELRKQIYHKLDRSIIETLTRAIYYADHETLNLQKIWYNNWIVLCIWGNLSKNPRIKQFTFTEIDLTFDISKVLTLSDCAFLINFIKFDNYSFQCQSYYPCKLPKSIHTESVIHEVIQQDGTLNEKNPFNESKTEETLLNDDNGEKQQTNEVEEVFEIPPEDRIPTPEPENWIKADMEEDAIDLGDYHVIGGVIRFELVSLPRQPKTVKGWTITTCVKPPKLHPFEYVVDTSEEIKTENESVVEETPRKQEKKEERPPIQVKIRIPKCIIIVEDPLLARWDPEKLQWRTTGIQLIKFNEDDNTIVFSTSVFGTIAIFQDYHINMPFQYWELRPLPLRRNDLNNTIVQSIHSDTTSATTNVKNSIITNEQQSIPMVKSTTPIMKSNEATSKEVINGSSPEPMIIEHNQNGITDKSKECIILGPVPTLGLSNDEYQSILQSSSTTNQCLLTIIGGCIELRLHILGDRISILPNTLATEKSIGIGSDSTMFNGSSKGINVTEKNDTDLLKHTKRELNHLWGKWFTLNELITVLQQSGMNIFPREDSVSRIECLNKNRLVEENLYQHMALLSPSMAFGWSRWNSECHDDHTIIVTAVEHVDHEDSIDEESWKVYSITRKKVQQLEMKEYDEQFCPISNPNQPFHADFYHMYMDFGCEEGKRRVEEIDLKYLKTVHKLLQATRLLVFS